MPLRAACTLFNWDQYNAPKGSIENTAKIIGTPCPANITGL